MELQQFGIVSPGLGIKEDIPSIFLPEAHFSDALDVLYKDGELHRAKKRKLEWTVQLPDPIVRQFYFESPSADRRVNVIFTKRDICYRDSANDRLVFINKIYNTGVIEDVDEITGGFILTFGSGVDLEAAGIKEGDYIQIDDSTSYHTDVDWYEIESVDSGNQLTCSGELPSGYEVPSGGQEYAIRITFSGTDSDYWSCTDFIEELIATNGIDNIIYWTGAGQVQDLDCPYKAKLVYKFENRVILGYLTIIDTSDVLPFAFAWTGLTAGPDKEDWGDLTGSDSSYLQCAEGTGAITQFSDYLGFLYIFKEKSIIRAQVVTTDEVFVKSLIVADIGTFSPASVVATQKGIFFLANDNTWRKFNGLSWNCVSENVAYKFKNINPAYSYLAQGYWIKELDQIVLAIPYLSSETNDKVFIYDYKSDSDNILELDMPVRCFGEYIQETSYTWNTIPFSSWAEWAWDRWATYQALTKNPIILVGGYDGYIYKMYGDIYDNDKSYEGYGVIETDLSSDKSLINIYKRLWNVKVYIKKEQLGTILEFEIQRDTDGVWQDAGNVSLDGTGNTLIKDLPVDFRARHFGIKIKAGNHFRLLGLIFEFLQDGDN